MLKTVKKTSAAAEIAFRHFVDDDAANDVGEVCMLFPEWAEEHDEWYLRVSRSNWAVFASRPAGESAALVFACWPA